MAAGDKDIKKNLHGEVRSHPGKESERGEHPEVWVAKAKSLLLLCYTLPIPTWGSNGRPDILSRDSQKSCQDHAQTL